MSWKEAKRSQVQNHQVCGVNCRRREKGGQEDAHQDGGDGEPLEEIDYPEAEGDRAEAVTPLDDERPVEVEGEADQAARQGQDAEEEEARQDEVLFPGGQEAEERGEQAAEQDNQREDVVEEALDGSKAGGIERVAGDLRERLGVDLPPEHLRDLMAVAAEVADVEAAQHPPHQGGGDKRRQEKDHEAVEFYHRCPYSATNR